MVGRQHTTPQYSSSCYPQGEQVCSCTIVSRILGLGWRVAANIQVAQVHTNKQDKACTLWHILL